MRRAAFACAFATLGGCAGLIGIDETHELTVEQLEVTPGALVPAFDPAVTDYTLDVPYATAALQVTAVSSSPTATLAIDGAPLTAHVAQNVAVGAATDLALVATSTSGVSVSYTIHVKAAAFGIDFEPVMMASADGMSNNIAAGDLDGDGFVDLVVTDIGGSRLSILRGTGGVFTSTGMSGAGEKLALGRVDDDDTLDVVVGTGALMRALGDGAGGFGSFASAINASISVYAIAIADFNGDQHADIAFGGAGAVRVQLGDGSGGFSDGPITSGPMLPSELAVGDFDGSGGVGIAAVDTGAQAVWVGTNAGTGAFTLRPLSIGADGGTSMTSADFDGDGTRDLAVIHSQAGTVEVITELAGATEQRVTVPAGMQPVAVVAGDFDADGHADLAVANTGGPGPAVTILRGDGSGHFAGKTFAFAPGPAARHLVAADFDNDGRTDLAYTTTTSTVGILLVKP